VLDGLDSKWQHGQRSVLRYHTHKSQKERRTLLLSGPGLRWLFAALLAQHPSPSQQIVLKARRVMSTFCDVTQKVSAIRNRLVHRYSGVFGLGARGQRFVVDVDVTFSSHLASLFLRWKTADTVFVVLSFHFQVWRYPPKVAMSLLSTPSTAC